MAHTITIPKFVSKHVPTAYSGYLATSIVYVGADRVALFLDNIVGGITQRIGVNIPIIGNFTLKDAVVYGVVSKGFRYNLPTVVGFFANKLLFGPTGQAVPSIRIPGFGSSSSIASPSSNVVQQPGAINVSQGAPL